MFGSRPDGDLIRDLSKMRAFMPFISPRRNDSLVYYKMDIEVDAAFELLERLNKDRDPKRRVTLFHVFLCSNARAFLLRSGCNRFVAGGRLWQRNHMAVTFSAKQEILLGSPTLTIKRAFDEGEGLIEMVDSILDRLVRRRGGEKTQSDKEMNFALRWPVPVVRAAVWLLHKANMLGMLPKSMIDDDPLFCTIFIANLGSVGLEAGYHHLWEWGTCSMFGVMGRVHTRPDGSRFMEAKFTYDERVEDGLYAGTALEEIKAGVEKPEILL